MKKLCSLLCCVLFLQFLGACSGSNDVSQPIDFYYCNVETGYNNPSAVICPESREAAFYNGSVERMLQDYLAGPRAEDLYSPVPADAELVSCLVEEGDVYILLSQEFAELSGIKLSVCCSCILMTLHEFTDVHTLHISAQDAQLDEKKEIVLNIDDIILMDTV